MIYKAPEDKRSQILSAAKTIFGRYGFSKATLEDIAKDLGMKKNSLYYYFPSKEALFLEVITIQIDKLFKMINSAIAGEKNSVNKLKIIFDAATKAAREDSSEGFTISAVVDNHLALKALYKDYNKNSISLLSGIISEGIEKGEIIPCSPQDVAVSIISMVEAIKIRDFYNSKAKFINEIDFAEADKSISVLLDLIINGLKAK